ncbi:MAG: aminoglycoside phosphotransferase family protein [Clostridiaceae bacterium]|nr:aminoglycoside phosphotransferase family protein [Clostridiaceae bacterium]
MGRLYKLFEMDEYLAERICMVFDPSLAYESLTPIQKGMSTSNYVLKAGGKNFLLKLYSSGIDNIELSMYSFLSGKISVPRVLFYDSSGNIVPCPYAIISFLNGTTLDEYIKKHGCYPTRIITQIAEGLARIHYSTFDRAALLNCNFNYKKDVPPVSVQIRKLLNDKAGKHLPDGQKERLIDLLDKRDDLFTEIERHYVLSHGDFTYGNILVDENDRVWFIDFENALSAGWLHDIGKFFRRKDDDIQKYINQDVFRYFAEAYNSKAKYQLPDNWLLLARLADIPGILFFLNEDNPTREWIDDIVTDIDTALSGV